ncbi:MAG: hypothetical protein KGI00_01915 [Candidatus Micrarchaeota archaeon]|nr:hypothetical protein [Candidatus Micrarchaeota archaeon]MDE1849465.1 hypothetical protein [Candidatus Micrarchaeota archaeon]
MAKAFSEINVKAAAITGAVIGFLCWLLVIPYSFPGYGMMGPASGNYPYYGGMMGYPYNGSGAAYPYYYGMMGYMSNMMGGAFHNYSAGSILLDVILGAVAGALIGILYNWLLKLK